MCNTDAEYSHAEVGVKVSKEIALHGHVFAAEWRIKDLSVIKTSLTTMGIIGNSFLGRYKVYFDIKNRLIYLS